MFVALALALVQDARPTEEPAFGPLEIGIVADVLGLHFSEPELELMLPDVLERLAEFEKLRAVHLGNEVAPALVFRPSIAGASAEPRSAGIVFVPGEGVRLPAAAGAGPSSADHAPDACERPADLAQLAYLDVHELGCLVRHRKVTCVEVAQTFLARLERLDEKLHCVVTLTAERALAQARELDRELDADESRGPLHGIPWVAKDLLAVAGLATTWGTPPFAEQVIDRDAAVVERLDAAGAVLIAKVSLGELAWGDVWTRGQTRNPWKLEQGSSGSSAGSAAAVAAGCAPFAIGSETLGSIVSPSDRCGASSLRPTFGRVSRYGAMTLCWSLDKLGPICRSAADAELVFQAISGPDVRDPSTVDAPFRSASSDVRGWKVGVPKGAFLGAEGPDCKLVLDQLESLGVELVEIELPDYPVNEMMIVLQAEAASAFDEFSRGANDDEMVRQERQAWPNVFRHAQLIPAVDYIRANRLRTLLVRDLEAALAGLKAIVHPSFAGSILALTNLTGHPTFVAPCGFREDGTPFSISFTGKLFGDAEILALAGAWQRTTDHHRRHPDL